MLKYSQEQIFKIGFVSSSQLRKYFREYGTDYCCSKCQASEWLGEPLTLELDHKNGDRMNNSIANLRWLCPNCHSQTETFKSRNSGGCGSKRVSDELFVEAIKSSKNIAESLLKVKLAPRGGNYERAKRLMAKHGLSFKSWTAVCSCGKFISRGAERCLSCAGIKARKIKRPTKDNLASMISKSSWEEIGRRFGITGNAVKKWARDYDLPIPVRRPNYPSAI